MTEIWLRKDWASWRSFDIQSKKVLFSLKRKGETGDHFCGHQINPISLIPHQNAYFMNL